MIFHIIITFHIITQRDHWYKCINDIYENIFFEEKLKYDLINKLMA